MLELLSAWKGEKGPAKLEGGACLGGGGLGPTDARDSRRSRASLSFSNFSSFSNSQLLSSSVEALLYEARIFFGGGRRGAI